MTKPTRSITIEFERMPGIIETPAAFRFEKYECVSPMDELTTAVICTCFIPYSGKRRIAGLGMTIRNPEDDDNWDVAMRVSARRACSLHQSTRSLYRAFRRWMWLAKAAHECHHNDSCRLCPAGHAPILLCRPKQMNDIIAAEFGRVKVRAE